MSVQVIGQLPDVIGIYEVYPKLHQLPPGMRKIRRVPEADGQMEGVGPHKTHNLIILA
jgi:hypothetical protein